MDVKNNTEIDEKLKNKNKLLSSFGTIGILTLIVAIIGITYAYFAATLSNNSISGESAGGNILSLNITASSANSTGKLTPQLDSTLQNAITGVGNGSCVNSDNETVCIVYTISLTNNSTTTLYIEGNLNLTAISMPNLKWALGTSATTGFSTTTYNPKSVTSLGSRQPLAGGSTINYYLAVWISETGSLQTDSGTFSGVVSFTGYNSANGTVGGITSTITE